jgi:hypothetical protein
LVSFFGAIVFAVFAAAGLAAGSVVFAAPKQNAAPINERATAATAIRDFIMRWIPAETSLGVNTNSSALSGRHEIGTGVIEKLRERIWAIADF